jgi:shikimate dehydrogenase
MRIDGNTRVIAHVGYPTSTFKAPLIYNPWFAAAGENTVVVPFSVKDGDLAAALTMFRRMANLAGVLVTMPHKIAVMDHLGEVSVTARIAGSCNAVKVDESGRLIGDMFDGEGFVRGLARKGVTMAGASALVVGAGGVGSAIAAALAARGVSRIGLFDSRSGAAEALAERLAATFPALRIDAATRSPKGFDIAVNATPLGMKDGDPLPIEVDHLSPATFVGEVVMKKEITPREGMRDTGGDRHAVRADPGLSRVLRPARGDT